MRANLGGAAGMFLLLIGANLGAWAWAFFAFRQAPVLLGTALLAYGLGLRHAADVDHIAAIDNVTRKLVQEGQRPLGVGLFFALGHSTIVFLVSIAVAATTQSFGGAFESLRIAGGIIGTAVSGSFLLIIATANSFALLSVHRTFRHARRGEIVSPNDLDKVLPPRGPIARVLRRLFSLISQSWQMYPLGFVFGLGFDTATEIALLSVSALAIAKGFSFSAVLVFPTLFTAGMSLVDTADGIFMVRAYGWAHVKPTRKLFYNIAITAISVGVALLVGIVEVLGLISSQFNMQGRFWQAAVFLNGNFLELGLCVIALFAIGWIGSAAVYRFSRLHRLEPRDLN
jgi:high-affinity nickel-transport protein